MAIQEQSQISFKKVTKVYGSTVALNNVSFDVKKGEFIFITGPSGVGKTTILRLILGEIVPNKGEVIIDGVNVVNLDEKTIPTHRQKIGTIFQDFKVLPERTVFENISVALAVIGLPEEEWEERVKHVLKLVGLGKKVDNFPSQLSGGELQRVSLARALSVNPKIVLADEPTGNLDWETSDSLMDLFEKINKEGKTVIMATHNMEIVKKYKHREIHLENDDGKIPGDPNEKVSTEKSKDDKKDAKIEKK